MAEAASMLGSRCSVSPRETLQGTWVPECLTSELPHPSNSRLQVDISLAYVNPPSDDLALRKERRKAEGGRAEGFGKAQCPIIAIIGHWAGPPEPVAQADTEDWSRLPASRKTSYCNLSQSAGRAVLSL